MTSSITYLVVSFILLLRLSKESLFNVHINYKSLFGIPGSVFYHGKKLTQRILNAFMKLHSESDKNMKLHSPNFHFKAWLWSMDFRKRKIVCAEVISALVKPSAIILR